MFSLLFFHCVLGNKSINISWGFSFVSFFFFSMKYPSRYLFFFNTDQRTRSVIHLISQDDGCILLKYFVMAALSCLFYYHKTQTEQGMNSVAATLLNLKLKPSLTNTVSWWGKLMFFLLKVLLIELHPSDVMTSCHNYLLRNCLQLCLHSSMHLLLFFQLSR